jgi:hypothetical protein
MCFCVFGHILEKEDVVENKKTLQSIIGAFAGGALGAFAGLSVELGSTGLGLVISALVGGLAGWVISDIQGFGAGMVRAWKAMRPVSQSYYMQPRSALENSDIFWTGITMLTLASTLVFMIAWVVLFVELVDPNSTIFGEHPLLQLLLFPYGCAGTFWLTGFIGIVLPIRFFTRKRDIRKIYYSDAVFISGIRLSKKITLFGNPFVVPLFFAWYFATTMTPWLWKFAVQLYGITVSNYRIAAMVGGSVGAASGYLIQQPLAGSLIGAAVWMGLTFFAPKSAKPQAS